MAVVKLPHKARPNKRFSVPGPVMPVNAKKRLCTIILQKQNFRLQHPETFDNFFWFVAERHRIHCLRIAGRNPPWTEDEILAEYAFTNVFRVFDRVTQYILCNVVGKGDEGLDDAVFRVLLFRTFNRIETWELLEAELGTLTWREFDVDKYEEILVEAADQGPLYGSVYIIPAPDLGWGRNYANHLRLIKLMMDQGLPGKLQKFEYLRDAHGYLCLYPGVGNFTGFQYLLDLNMLPYYNWDEHLWAALGPGSKSGIQKMFGPSVRGQEDAALEFLHDSLPSHFARLGIVADNIPRLCDGRPPGLSMVDLEHSLCEYDKYCRARFPLAKGGARTHLRNKFNPNPNKPTAELPAKWTSVQKALTLSKPPAVKLKNGEPYYEVSHIVAEKERCNATAKRYLVRWMGWGPEDDVWMSENDLVDAPSLLRNWNQLKEGIEKGVAELRAKVPKPLTNSARRRRDSSSRAI